MVDVNDEFNKEQRKKYGINEQGVAITSCIKLHEKYSTGFAPSDVIDKFFNPICHKDIWRFDKEAVLRTEIQHFGQIDTYLHNLRFNNRVIAFVIETRTDFNNLEYIFGRTISKTQLKKEVLQERKKRGKNIQP